MKTFNLIAEPWIPVRYLAGRNSLVSLSTLFSEASQIGDLDCPAHERISIMRLLVCITQAALGAPETGDDWCGFGSDMETRIPDYLRRDDIAPHFNLFGDGPRFLQDGSILRDSKFKEHTSWIVFHLASGNNFTLFDHGGGTCRKLPSDLLARSLLTFQNFSPPVGQHTSYGFCSENNCLHTVLLGEDIKGSILLNCLDVKTISKFFQGGLGKPFWAQEADRDALSSYLNRLVPRHRRLWLEDESSLFKSYDGISYPLFKTTGIRESSQTVVLGARGRYLLKCSPTKSVWRDLHSLTVERLSDGSFATCATIQSHFEELLEHAVFPIFVGGLVFENTASLTSVVESSLSVPKRLLQDDGRSCFIAALSFAEDLERGLLNALRIHAEALKFQVSPVKQQAIGFFWSALDGRVPLLLDIVRDPSVMEAKSFGEGDDSWTIAVRKAARDAYDHVCGRITSRQLKAYAAGLKVLFPKSKKPKPQKETTSL